MAALAPMLLATPEEVSERTAIRLQGCSLIRPCVVCCLPSSNKTTEWSTHAVSGTHLRRDKLLFRQRTTTISAKCSNNIDKNVYRIKPPAPFNNGATLVSYSKFARSYSKVIAAKLVIVVEFQ
ncbi:hypothetical protein LSTR_LSTR005001 [Laodelphax striatellus]|uniref:Uncharacterized protein n=1 Tax=Laodelphax striatellus TaxID=195883 RepID=A0A482XIG2_LAOST|nr:hypothetical protein LSTR_LSTR005001 [Laodelphax striatellus]